MIAMIQDVEAAKVFAKETIEEDLIPVFQADEVDVTQNNESEMIVYCKKLQKSVVKYRVSPDFLNKKDICIVKLKDINEEFATCDLLQ